MTRHRYSVTAAVLLITFGCASRPPAGPPITPDEIADVCDSLATYVVLGQEARNSGMEQGMAFDLTREQMKKSLAKLAPDRQERYAAAVRELYRRIWALDKATDEKANAAVTPACAQYAPDQYGESEVKAIRECDRQVAPYVAFADSRDHGTTLDEQLAQIEEKLAPQAPPQERAARTAALSDMAREAYRRKDVSKADLYKEKLGACLESRRGESGEKS